MIFLKYSFFDKAIFKNQRGQKAALRLLFVIYYVSMNNCFFGIQSRPPARHESINRKSDIYI